MNLQIRVLQKATATDCTLERPFLCVRALVPLQTRQPGKHFIARHTLKRLILIVDFDVAV